MRLGILLLNNFRFALVKKKDPENCYSIPWFTNSSNKNDPYNSSTSELFTTTSKIKKIHGHSSSTEWFTSN